MVTQRLKALRRGRNLSQVELARRARVSQSYLSRLEKGVLDNPSSEVVKRLADALEVPVALLYAEPGEEDLTLRGELQSRIEQAVEKAGEDPEAAEALADSALEDLLASLALSEADAGGLRDWGRRFIESRVALLRYSLLERHGIDQATSIAVKGSFRGYEDPKGEVRPAGTTEKLRLPKRMTAIRVARDGLVPGVGPGNLLLVAPTEEPREGDLAIVCRGEKRFVRRIFQAVADCVLLIPPGSFADPALPPGTYARAEVEFEGRVAGILY